MVTGLAHGIIVPPSQSLRRAGLVPVTPLTLKPTKAAWKIHFTSTNCLAGPYAGKDDVDADQTSRSRNLHLRHRLLSVALFIDQKSRKHYPETDTIETVLGRLVPAWWFVAEPKMLQVNPCPDQRPASR